MKCARQTCGGPARLRKVFAAGTGIGWRSSRCNRLFVLPLGLVVDAALRVHGGVLASTPVLWIAVQVESDALDSNGDSLTERTCLLVRIKIRGLFCRYGRQNWDRTTYRMSILASEGIEPLFRLRRRAHLERPRARPRPRAEKTKENKEKFPFVTQATEPAPGGSIEAPRVRHTNLAFCLP